MIHGLLNTVLMLGGWSLGGPIGFVAMFLLVILKEVVRGALYEKNNF